MVEFTKKKSFDNYTVALRSDGIIQVDVDANFEMDVKHVKIIVDIIKEIGEEKVYPLMMVVGEYTLPTPEARDYIASAESDPYASAEAYVVNSFSQRLVGNVYLRLNQPARPTKIFNEPEKAIEWLKGYLK